MGFKRGMVAKANTCREVENILGAFCNEEITRKKSVRKKARRKRTQELKIGRGKVKLT